MDGSGEMRRVSRAPHAVQEAPKTALHKNKEALGESYKQRQRILVSAVERLFDSMTSVRGLKQNMQDDIIVALKRAKAELPLHISQTSHHKDRGFFGEAKERFTATVVELEGKVPSGFASAAVSRMEAQKDLGPLREQARKYGRQSEHMLIRLARHITTHVPSVPGQAPETVVPIAMDVITGWQALFPDGKGPLRTGKIKKPYTVENVRYLASNFAQRLVELMQESASMDAEFISRNGPPVDKLIEIANEARKASRSVESLMDASIREARTREKATIQARRKGTKSKVAQRTLEVSTRMDDVTTSEYVHAHKEVKAVSGQLADLLIALKEVKEIQKHYLPALAHFDKGEEYFALAEEVVAKVRDAIERIQEEKRGLRDAAHDHEERARGGRAGSAMIRYDELRLWMGRQDKALSLLRQIDREWSTELTKGLPKVNAR